MDYLFKSEDCPSCKKLLKKIKTYKNWRSLVTLVDVKFDRERGKFWTWTSGKDSGESPVGRVPAFYGSKSDSLLMGYNAIIKEIENDDRYREL